MAENPSMAVRYWGVRGSIPSPLDTQQIRAKEETLIRRIAEDGGVEKLFGSDINSETVQHYLNSLPLTLSFQSGQTQASH